MEYRQCKLDALGRMRARELEEDYDREELGHAVAALEVALSKSIDLQSHYAKLLNMHDGGKRIEFHTVQAWLERLFIEGEKDAIQKTK